MKPTLLLRKICMLISLLFFLVIWSNSAMAQAKTGRKHRIFQKSAEKKAKKLSHRQTRKFHLSGEQSQEITSINQKFEKREDLLKSRKDLDQKTRMERLKSLDEERNNQYKSVLHPQQYKKWNDWEIRKPEKARDFRGKKVARQ
ncbi:MAG: hypothetical protein ACYCOO_10940 [Chitinophagaceae bacterium]